MDKKQRLYNAAEAKSIRRQAAAVADLSVALRNPDLTAVQQNSVLMEISRKALEISKSSRRLRAVIRRTSTH